MIMRLSLSLAKREAPVVMISLGRLSGVGRNDLYLLRSPANALGGYWDSIGGA
jgi:hypothetical protein